MEVNLRKLYPSLYHTDEYVEVTEAVFEAISAFERAEAAWQRRKYRYKAHYSLDYGNGIENDILFRPETPEAVFEEKLLRRDVFAALRSLSGPQRRRVYARYFLEQKPAQIAVLEQIQPGTVCKSVHSGLRKLARRLAHLKRR